MPARRTTVGLALVVALSWAGALAERRVEASGSAAPARGQPALSARQLAIDDALRNAVEAGVGVFLTSQTLVKNFELVEDRVLKRAKGFGRVDKVLSEGATAGGRYAVRIAATVDGRAIATTLRDTLKGFDDPRVAVLLAETLGGKPTAGSAASTALSKALADAGYRVLDPGQVAQNLRREALAAAGDAKAVGRVGARLGVDLVLTGTARASQVANADLAAAGMVSSRGVLEVRLVDATTGQLAWTESFDGAEYDASLDAAASKALGAAGGRAAAAALPRLAAWIQGGLNAPPVHLVKVTGFGSFSAFNTFVQKLKTTAGVKNVQPRDYDAAGTVIEVEFSGNTNALAVLLEKLGLTVTGVTGREVRAKPRPAAGGSR